MQKAFRYFDASQNNNVEWEEFREGCQKVGLRFSPKELEVIFQKFDTAKNGCFTYDDFVRLNGDQRCGKLDIYKMGKR